MQLNNVKQYGIDVSSRVYATAIILIGISNWYMSNVNGRFIIFPYSAGIFMVFHWLLLFYFMYITYYSRKTNTFSYYMKLIFVLGYSALMLFEMIYVITNIIYMALFMLVFITAQYDLMFYDYSGTYLVDDKKRLYYYLISTVVYVILFLLGNIGFVIAVIYRRSTRDIFLTKINKKTT